MAVEPSYDPIPPPLPVVFDPESGSSQMSFAPSSQASQDSSLASASSTLVRDLDAQAHELDQSKATLDKLSPDRSPVDIGPTPPPFSSPPDPTPSSSAFMGLHALSAIAAERASPISSAHSETTQWSVDVPQRASTASPLHVMAGGEATASPISFKFAPPSRGDAGNTPLRPSPSPSPSAHSGLSLLEATAVLALDRRSPAFKATYARARSRSRSLSQSSPTKHTTTTTTTKRSSTKTSSPRSRSRSKSSTRKKTTKKTTASKKKTSAKAKTPAGAGVAKKKGGTKKTGGAKGGGKAGAARRRSSSVGSAGGDGDGDAACTHCQAKQTSQWRRNKFGPSPICNACYAHTLTHMELPPLDEQGNRIYASGRKPKKSSRKRRRALSSEPMASNKSGGDSNSSMGSRAESAPPPALSEVTPRKRQKVLPLTTPLAKPGGGLGGGGGGLLDGYTCLVTGLDDGKVDRKAEIVSLIKSHGGSVVSHVPDGIIHGDPADDADPSAPARVGTVVISDSPRRTTKYLVALAVGIPTIHFQWILDSVAAGSILPHGSYFISSGYSLVMKTHLSANVFAVGSRVFRGLTIFVSGSATFEKFWGVILSAAGASSPSKSKLKSLRSSIKKASKSRSTSAAAASESSETKGVAAAKEEVVETKEEVVETKGVADMEVEEAPAPEGGRRRSSRSHKPRVPLSGNPGDKTTTATTTTSSSTEAEAGSGGAADEALTNAIAKAVQGVSFVLTDIEPVPELVAGASKAGISLVSFEYVTQCIINQRVLPADAHAKFHHSYWPKPKTGTSSSSSSSSSSTATTATTATTTTTTSASS